MTPRTRMESRSTPLRNPQRAIGLFLGVAVLAVLLVAPSLDPGFFVPRLTVDNPTPFDLTVEVTGGDRDGWYDVGTVGRELEDVLEEVADPGSTWVIRFSYAGVEGGEVTVPGSELRAAGWRLTVPAAVGTALAEAGFVPSAR
ncbi:MAG TPA: hypothetical protein VM942_11505 [Acidimicrobiales bacterium]|nr:hypothetical protein [Acidimicrobiales bacterium]